MISSTTHWYRRQAAKFAYRRGRSYAQQTNYQASIDTLTQALVNHPDPADVYVTRGLSYWKLGDTQSAIADFETALALQPIHPQAHGNRGLLRYELGDEAGALADWAIALGQDPNYAEIYYNRALIHAHHCRYPEALRDLNQALTLRPNWAEAYFHRGNVRSHLGDQTAALNDWEIATYNDLSFTAAKEKLQALQASCRSDALVEPLNQALSEQQLCAQIKRIDDHCLEIIVNRQVGAGISYFTLPDLIRDVLLPLRLPDISRFKLIGKVSNPRNPGWSKQEWSREYELYKDQPCPPSNWQIALSMLVMFPPIGATALIYAVQVKKFYKQGDYLEAVHASQVTRRLCLAGVGLLCGLAMMPLTHAALRSIRNETAPPQRTARTIDYNPAPKIQLE